MIDERLTAKLWSVFPESFELVREYEKYDRVPGPWGVENVFSGMEIESLSDNILNTAESFRKKYGIESALDYLQQFSKSRIRKIESTEFHSA